MIKKYKMLFAEEASSLDWGASSFDWSQSAKRVEEDKLELNWDDDDAGEAEDVDTPPMSMKLDKKEKEEEEPAKLENDDSKKLLFFLIVIFYTITSLINNNY